MKNSIRVLLIILLGWIAWSSYYYVCKIRDDCRKNFTADLSGQKTELSKDILTGTDSITSLPLPSPMVVYFNLNTKTCIFTDEEDIHLSDIANYIKANPSDIINLKGHSDNIGSSLVNVQISTERAEFVKDKLVEMGVNPANIKITMST